MPSHRQPEVTHVHTRAAGAAARVVLGRVAVLWRGACSAAPAARAWPGVRSGAVVQAAFPAQGWGTPADRCPLPAFPTVGTRAWRRAVRTSQEGALLWVQGADFLGRGGTRPVGVMAWSPLRRCRRGWARPAAPERAPHALVPNLTAHLGLLGNCQ